MGGTQFTPDVACGTHCFEHLRMLVFVASDLGVESVSWFCLKSVSLF